MFVLITALYILAIGKILCQTRVTQEVQYLPSPFLPGRVSLPRHFHRQTPPPQTLHYLQQTTDKSNVTATTQQTAFANQQKRKLLISRVESRKMDQNRSLYNSTNSTIAKQDKINSTSAQNNTRISTSNDRSNSTDQNNADIYDKVVFEDDPPMDNCVKTGEASPAARNGSSTGPTEPKTPVTEPAPVANVTLEDRSSFDGDPCPTGYVRVNGVCVLPE